MKVFEPVNLVKRIYALEHKSSFIKFPSKRQQKRRSPICGWIPMQKMFAPGGCIRPWATGR